jgi:DME family drug/metabolite transporter
VETHDLSVPARSGFLGGALYVLAAGLCWSFTGIFVRLAPHLDSWQFLAWRSLGVACVFAIIARAQSGDSLVKRVVSMGRADLVVVMAICIAATGYIVALKATTVANALFLSSCSPLLAAILGYFVLGERLSLAQAASVALGLAGLLAIVGGSVEAGSFVGNVCAVLSALGFAVASVAMRHSPKRDFTPAVFGYGTVTCVLATLVCVARGATLFPPALELIAAFSGGFLLMGLGFTLFLHGAPKVPAAAQTVLAQTETIFGPVWVWLAFGETPATSTLIGGAIILVAIVSMAAAGAGAPLPNAAT